MVASSARRELGARETWWYWSTFDQITPAATTPVAITPSTRRPPSKTAPAAASAAVRTTGEAEASALAPIHGEPKVTYKALPNRAVPTAIGSSQALRRNDSTRASAAATPTTPTSTCVVSRLAGGVRKSPLGQMPKSWSQLRRLERLAYSVPPVNAPVCESQFPAATNDGIANSAAATTRATEPRSVRLTPAERSASRSAAARSGASQPAPPTLRTPTVAAQARANGRTALTLSSLLTVSGTSATPRTSKAAIASSFTPPQSA